jgi:hypothetical protein
MSVDVEAEVLIARPRSEVAAFMFDPTKDAIWTTGVVESRPLTEGTLRTGSKVERVSKFLGRRFAYLFEVTDHGPDAFVAMKVDEPFPMRIRYELEDAPGDATKARIRTSGEATGFFAIAGPLLSRMVRRSITNDLENLREYLEAAAARR